MLPPPPSKLAVITGRRPANENSEEGDLDPSGEDSGIEIRCEWVFQRQGDKGRDSEPRGKHRSALVGGDI